MDNQRRPDSSKQASDFTDRLLTYLKNATSSDQQTRVACEAGITELQNSDFASFMRAVFLAVDDPAVGMVAAIVLKNALHASEPTLQRNIEARWGAIDPAARDEIKNCIVQKLAVTQPKIRSLVAASLAGIARMEVLGCWPGFFADMQRLFVGYAPLRGGIIECIGTAAALLSNETRFSFARDEGPIFQMLLAALQNGATRREALEAFPACVRVFSATFNTIQPLDQLLVAITSYSDDDAPVSIECLGHLVTAGYEKLRLTPILEKIVIFVNGTLSSPREDIVLCSIDFWTRLLELEKDDGSQRMSEKYMDKLIQLLLNHLYRADEQDLAEWNAHKAASSALKTLSRISAKDLLTYDLTRQFISKNTQASLLQFKRDEFGAKENLPNKEIGFIALGSVVNEKSFPPNSTDDSNPIEFLREISRIVIDHFESEIAQSAMWCMSEICLFNCRILESDGYFEKMIGMICDFIQQADEVSLNAAWLLNNICECISKEPENRSIKGNTKSITDSKKSKDNTGNFLSPLYMKIMNVLVLTIERIDIENMNLRLALFSALNELIKCTSSFSLAEIDRLLDFILLKIDECMGVAHALPADKFLIFEDLMSNYVILLQTIVGVRTEAHLRDKREQILQTFVCILSLKRSSTVFGDVYIALSHLCSETSYFTIKIERILPFVHRDLVCAASATDFGATDGATVRALINLVGDLANTLSLGFLRYSAQIVSDLVLCLTTDRVTRDAKAAILVVLGDIAMALGPSYGTYLGITLEMVAQILQLERAQNIVYVDTLRQNSLQLLNCIVMGMNDDPRLLERMDTIVPMVVKIANEDDRDHCLLDTLNLI
ncbi:Importin subunit beta, partial [Dictyocoela roeselum]